MATDLKRDAELMRQRIVDQAARWERYRHDVIRAVENETKARDRLDRLIDKYEDIIEAIGMQPQRCPLLKPGACNCENWQNGGCVCAYHPGNCEICPWPQPLCDVMNAEADE